MKKFSKLFWVALVVVAVLACTALGVFAAGVESTAVIYGETVEVAEGENFSVDFNFKFKGNNTKVECGKITLTWDSAKMAAVENGIVPGEALGDAQFGFKIEDGKAVIAWAGSEINAETGTLFTVNFTNKGVAVDGYAGIEVAVDNFGYTNGFFKTELKDTVKANRVFATGSEFANEAIYGNDTTDTLAEFWNKVAGLAEIGNVTVNVEKDMKFDSAITVGPLVNKVTVKSSNGSSLIVNNGVKVTFDGNLEFNNICIYATGNTAGKFDTGFCFPAGAYGTFGENITISGSTPIDISGNATIKSGTYHEVYGNGNLTIEGGTFNSRVFGGYLLTDSTEQTGDVTMTIKGGTFKGAVLGGSLITGGATFSGDVNMTISGVDGTLGNTWGGSLINTAANGKHSGKVTLTVELEKGTVTNLYGGSSISVGTAAQHSGEVDLIVKKGTVTTVYGGSTLYTSKHTGTTNVTIEGGTITTVYGGSNGQGAISHTGASNVTIKGGTISASIYGGSNLVYNNAKQTGKSTLKLIGTEGKTISALSKGGSYIAGGSYSNKSGANHEADSELIIENIYTQSYGGKTKNLTVMVSDVLSNNARYIFGGSLFTGDGKHVGNSSVTIKNSILTDIPTIAGGSCLNTNGTAAAHQGNSSLTIDAENGFGYFQNIRRCTATNFYESGIVAGSIINSWATAPALPKANHTGTSNLYVKAPTEGTSKRINFKEDANAKLYDSFTGKELALDCNLYAGNYYTDNNHLSQQNNSTAEITGSCVLLGYRDWDKMTFVFGGSYYAATKSSVLSTQLRTPSTNKIINKVIIDGCNWLCDAFAGYYWKSTGKTQTMNVDLAIIYKNGGKVGNGNAYVTPMASATGSNGALLLTNNGDVLFEIHTGDADITGQTFKWSPAWQATVNGSKCVKFVEDGTGKFSGTFNLNTKAQYLDISHVSNDVTVKQVDKYNAVIGDGYTYLINNRIAGKNVYFANAGTELPEVGAALAGIKQVEVVPETKFSDLTASP
ncbi:MAG: hypothetical protein IKU48_01355, partial [Clostridia bacterium]|nr:hypothetical protein [Clostridia bacterium]